MRDETSLVNEVRVKLHIKSNTDSQVRNLWMCLNYDQKPSVSHIVEHIRKNFCLHEDKRAQYKPESGPEVKLYLDDFWLPPYEHSRLIRENDCIKVELNYEDDEHFNPQDKPLNGKNKQMAQHKADYYPTRSKPLNYNEQYPSEEQVDQDDQYYGYENEDYYNHYYDNNDEETHVRPAQAKYNQQRAESFDPFEFWTSNLQTNETREKQQEKRPNSKKQKEIKPQPVVNNKPAPKSQPESPKPKQKPVQTCYKKFAVGSYAHLLNEQPTETKTTSQKKTTSQPKPKETHDEEARANYYQQQQAKKSNENDYNADFDKIASNVNTTGRQKWKNSTKQTQSNGPKHIIFPSSDDSSSSSSSSSDSDSDEETTKKPVQTTAPKRESITTALKKVQPNQKKFYEPTKEEQLNAVNTNRSYTVQNTKSISEFKKVFNETKLNAPKAEEFVKHNKPAVKPVEKKQAAKVDQLNTSTDSTSSSSSSSSSSSPTSSPGKKGRKSPASPKVNYEKLAKLEGMPRLSDTVAFQILEISSNFTPEISAYKTGTVLEIDNATNEVTIRLNNKYNAVLKRASKFSVVLDETEEENLGATEEEPVKMAGQKSHEDNLLKVDWRNLINLKLLPEETKTEKMDLPKFTEQQQHHVELTN